MLVISAHQYNAIENGIAQNLTVKFLELLEEDYPAEMNKPVGFKWEKYIISSIRYLREAGFEDNANYYFFVCLAVEYPELRNPNIPAWVNDYAKNHSIPETLRLEQLEMRLQHDKKIV